MTKLFLISALALALTIPPIYADDNDAPPPMLTKQADVLALFARNGDAEGVDTMIERGADVNGVDSNGNTPLTEALQGSHLTLALDLINRGAKADVGNQADGGMTIAIMRGNVDVVKALIAHGAPVDTTNLPAAENAAGIGSLEMVKLVLASGAKINRRDVLDGNAVLTAVTSGKADVLRYLLEHGGDPNVLEKDGETPLTRAIVDGHADMIPLLLAHGADVRRTNSSGYTPLDLADDGRHPETYPRLKAAWMKIAPAQRHRIGQMAMSTKPAVVPAREALFSAASSGDAETVRVLLSHGVSPIGRPWDDYSALYLGVRSQNAAVVRLLLEHGAPIDEREPMNNTPICQAAIWAETSIAKLLIDRGAKVNPDNVSNPPLTSARNAALVKLLLDHGADVDARDAAGATALWYASDLDDASIASMLLAHGADVNAVDLASGDTPLIRAARHGRREIVSMLIAKGADPSVANFAGQTAFDVAGDGYHPKTLAVLHAGAGTGVARDDGRHAHCYDRIRSGTPA